MIGEPQRILIVAGLCVLGLIGLVVRETSARADGVEVLIPMQAVDPRALLAGHFVRIDLGERLAEDQTCPPQMDDAEWVGLVARDGVHHAVGAGATREEASALGDLAARGAFTCRAPMPALGDMPAQAGALTLSLGVERFYINQTDAQRIEQVMFEQRPDDAEPVVFAILIIDQSGRAHVKGVQVEGQRYESTWR